jgi:hypothetical protein
MAMGLPPVMSAVFLIPKSFWCNLDIKGDWYVCMYVGMHVCKLYNDMIIVKSC